MIVSHAPQLVNRQLQKAPLCRSVGGIAAANLPLAKFALSAKLTEGLYNYEIFLFTIPPSRQAVPPPLTQGRRSRLLSTLLIYLNIRASASPSAEPRGASAPSTTSAPNAFHIGRALFYPIMSLSLLSSPFEEASYHRAGS